MYDVLVLPEMRVQDDFHLDLFRCEAAGFERVLFVDEFDRDDWFRRVVWDGFADTRGFAVSE
jgi:hypothetical protein